jgi:hypothetical protein
MVQGAGNKMRNSIGILVSFALIPILTSCRPTSSRTVIAYVSEDQVFQEHRRDESPDCGEGQSTSGCLLG